MEQPRPEELYVFILYETLFGFRPNVKNLKSPADEVRLWTYPDIITAF